MFKVKSVTSNCLLERRVVVETMGVDLEFTFPLFCTNNCQGDLAINIVCSLQRKSSFKRQFGLASSPYQYYAGNDVDYVASAQAQYIITKSYSWFKQSADIGRRHLICIDPEPGKELDAILSIYNLYYRYESPRIMIPVEANGLTWERNLLRLFHPKGATLATCAREYRYFNGDYQEYWRAKGACSVASYDFIELLQRRGVTTRSRRSSPLPFSSLSGSIAGGLDIYTLDHAAPHGSHCYLLLSYGAIEDGFVLDWTYRQFDGKSPFPFIRRFRGTEIHEPWWRYSLENPYDAERQCEYPPVYE